MVRGDGDGKKIKNGNNNVQAGKNFFYLQFIELFKIQNSCNFKFSLTINQTSGGKADTSFFFLLSFLSVLLLFILPFLSRISWTHEHKQSYQFQSFKGKYAVPRETPLIGEFDSNNHLANRSLSSDQTTLVYLTVQVAKLMKSSGAELPNIDFNQWESSEHPSTDSLLLVAKLFPDADRERIEYLENSLSLASAVQSTQFYSTSNLLYKSQISDGDSRNPVFHAPLSSSLYFGGSMQNLSSGIPIELPLSNFPTDEQISRESNNNTAAIPEPSTIIGTVTSLGSLVLYKRRRSKK